MRRAARGRSIAVSDAESGLTGPCRGLRLGRACRSGAGRDLISRLLVIRDEKFRDHAALLQVDAESLRVIWFEKTPRERDKTRLCQGRRF